MKTHVWRRLVAALCLFACACSARAVTITFNPATTATFLDMTISAVAGPWKATAQQDGWIVDIGLGWYVGGLNMTAPTGHQWFSFAELVDPAGPVDVALSIERGNPSGPTSRSWTIGNPQWLWPTPYAPTLSVRVLWSAATVPDGGSAGALFAAGLGALCLVRRHRVRSMEREPLPRGL